MALKEIQREALNIRELWIKEMEINNALEDGDPDGHKILKTMLQKMHTQAMNEKLNRINNGERM